MVIVARGHVLTIQTGKKSLEAKDCLHLMSNHNKVGQSSSKVIINVASASSFTVGPSSNILCLGLANALYTMFPN